MGARKNRSTETALDLLLSQIRATWNAGGVATLLSMDISGAYDHVVRERLTHILLWQKGVPSSVVGWVQSFITGRTTTLVFDGRESEPLQIASGIPQAHLSQALSNPIPFLQCGTHKPLQPSKHESEWHGLCRRQPGVTATTSCSSTSNAWVGQGDMARNSNRRNTS